MPTATFSPLAGEDGITNVKDTNANQTNSIGTEPADREAKILTETKGKDSDGRQDTYPTHQAENQGRDPNHKSVPEVTEQAKSESVRRVSGVEGRAAATDKGGAATEDAGGSEEGKQLLTNRDAEQTDEHQEREIPKGGEPIHEDLPSDGPSTIPSTKAPKHGTLGKWPADYEVVPPSTVPIEKPTNHDVLFGRGGLTNHHPGNKRFRDIIAVHRPDYVAAIKIEKPNVARKIIRAIRCGSPTGRFLKKNTNDGFWYDVGDRHAAEKASQALREKGPGERYGKSSPKKEIEKLAILAKSPFGPYGLSPVLPVVAGQPGYIPPHGQMTPSQSEIARRMSTPMMQNPGVTTPSPQELAFRRMSNSMMLPGYLLGQPLQAGHPIAFVPHPSPMLPAHVVPVGVAAAKNVSDGVQKEETVSGKKRKGPDQPASPQDENTADRRGKKTKVSEGAKTKDTLPPESSNDGDISPTDHDILCGRGGLTNHHIGNKRFRDIVSLHRPDYIRAPKIEKPSVARLIVAAIRNGNPPGRFLKKDPSTGKWYDIGDKRAAEKASQALREKTPEERIKIAAKNDRPMPTRQYFLPTGASAELPFTSGAGSDGASPDKGPDQGPDQTDKPPQTTEKGKSNGGAVQVSEV